MLCGTLAERETGVLRALGQHLWRELQAPRQACQQAEIELVTGDPSLTALPWHLVHDGVGWLDAREVGVRCTSVKQAPARSFAKSIFLLAGGHDLLGDERKDWFDILQPLSSGEPRVHIAAPDELLAGINDLDLLFLPLDGKKLGSDEDGPLILSGGQGLEWAAVVNAVKDHPPALILIECDRIAPYSLLRKAVRLAEHAAVVVFSRPLMAAGPLRTGDLARRFVDELHTSALPPSAVARRVAHGFGLATTQLPRTFGGPICPQPPPDAEWWKWWNDPGWRVSLDRKEQVGRAIKAIKDAWDARNLDAGLVLAWQGPPHSGLMRFPERLQHEVESGEMQTCDVLSLGWPENPYPTIEDFAEHYQHALQLEPASIGDDRDKMQAGLARAYPPSATRHHVLFVIHGLLEADFYGDERIDSDLLRRYIRWWARSFLPGVPQRITPVLLLALEDAPDAWPPPPQELDVLGNGLLPCSVVGLRRLPDVVAKDIEEVIWRYELPISADARAGVCEQICQQTAGRYEETVHAVECLPWTWRTWWRLHQKGKRQQ